MAPDDSTVKKSSGHGGKREGAGRKHGQLNQATKDRAKVLAEVRERIAANADRLISAQMSIALGARLLFRIDVDEQGRKTKPQLVTDEAEVAKYLAGEYEGATSSYHLMTTELPDNKAIEALLDRAFGKAQQNVDLTSDDKPVKFATIVNLSEPDSDTRDI